MELKLYPDRILRRKCQPVREVDDEVLRRAEEMLQFMYESDGVGLAGPQIAWPRQILTLDVGGEHLDPRIFVNPRIVNREGYIEIEEGCLSLPERGEAEAEGLAAVAWQHELDHLNGILFIDHLAPTQLITIRDELKRMGQEVREQDSTPLEG